MDVSEDLANLNFSRFKEWKIEHTTVNARQAILAFKGDVYLGLKAETFDKEDFEFAQKHLRILSGLYGILRPLDLIEPYRLEMGTKISVGKAKNLYEFWAKDIVNHLNLELKQHPTPILLNLASQEYFKVVAVKNLSFPIIHIDFKEIKNGKPITVGFFSKKARGMMSSFIIRQKINQLEALKSFNEEKYEFNQHLSTENQWIFTRDSE
ncbi:MAG: peroxide stress protein YaaA [Flammeovirgaceae bacterium]